MEAILVIGAAVANFVLGAFWYGLFRNQWMLARNLSDYQINDKDPKPYLIAFIGSLWASYGLFLIIKHIHPKDMSELLTIAIGTWMFILVGFGSKHYAFARVKGKAFVIDYGLDLMGVIVMCLIINEY
jgi:hypothetical protein